MRHEKRHRRKKVKVMVRLKTRGYVYRIYFPKTEHCYIGMTTNVKRRISEQGERSQKYEHETLHKFDDMYWTAAAEIELITQHRKAGVKLYNVTPGGDWRWTKKQAKEVMSWR